MALTYCAGLLGWCWLVASLRAQPTAPILPIAPQVQEIVADSSKRVVLASGKLVQNFSWELAPGGSYALKFLPPATGQHQISSIRLHLMPFGRHTAQGQVRLCVVGVAADGSPADDNPLLPPSILSTHTLQAVDQPLTLTWPTAHAVVPASGFFVVIEGLGEAPDEYTISAPRVVLAGKGYYQMGRRSQPSAAPRLLSTWSIPSIAGAKRTNPQLEFWMRGGDLPGWQSFPQKKRVPMMEVSFN